MDWMRPKLTEWTKQDRIRPKWIEWTQQDQILGSNRTELIGQNGPNRTKVDRIGPKWTKQDQSRTNKTKVDGMD